MSLQRVPEGAADLSVQSTVSALHIPVSHAFIPFQQFSLTDASLRNPADDNNNKAAGAGGSATTGAVPVVSVVAAVSGLCPSLPVVSMQQQQLQQAVVAPTIIPTVVTPVAVQTANGLTPTSTITMTNNINDITHLSMHAQQQQHLTNAGLSLSTQPNLTNCNTNSNNNGKLTNPGVSLNNGTVKAGSNNNPSNMKSPSSNNMASNSNVAGSNTNGSKSGINGVTIGQKSSSTNSSSSSGSGQNANGEQTDDLVKPVFKDGELVLEVECGQNKGILYLSKLCQGSKGPCISFQSSWLTPNEFQFVSGRETAKDWKRSIRHHGKSLKLLLAKGILNVHPTMCDCDGCRQGATLTRKGEKRRIPNGDRKPRKPVSNSSAGHAGPESHVPGGAFRPVGPPPSAMATKTPEGKRPGAENGKPKERSTVPQSSMKDSALLAAKSPGKVAPSRPDTLGTSSTLTQNIAGHMTIAHHPSSAPSTPAGASVSSGSNFPHVQGQHSASTHNSPTTPSRQPVFPTNPVGSPNNLSPTTKPNSQNTPTHQQPFLSVAVQQLANLNGTAAAASLSPSSTSSPTGKATALAQAGTLSNAVPPSASIPGENPQLLSPIVPKSDQAQIPQEGHHNRMDDGSEGSSSESLPSSLSDRGEEVERLNSHDEEEEEEDNEDDDYSSCDENVEGQDKEKDVDDGNESKMGALTIDVGKSEECGTDQNSAPNTDVTIIESEISSQTPVKKQGEDSESKVSSIQTSSSETEAKSSSPSVNIPEAQSSISSASRSTNSSSSSSCAIPVTNTTFAVSSLGSPLTQPLSVSVPSSNNVRAEHIWVPPTLSPPQSKAQLNTDTVSQKSPHTSQKRSNMDVYDFKTEAQKKSVSADIYDFKPEPANTFYPIKIEEARRANANCDDLSKKNRDFRDSNHSAIKQEDSKQNIIPKDSKVHNGDSSNNKDFSVSSLTNSHNSHSSQSNSEKIMREKEREREERHRQRAREERNRKDREREERRERERREERENEKRRQEERERREYAARQQGAFHPDSAKVDLSRQGLNIITTSSSTSMAAPSVDLARRLPGGAAEAAAFSDYMRVLAAGHGHAFLPQQQYSFDPRHERTTTTPTSSHPSFNHYYTPPNPAYSMSLFQIRPPDSSPVAGGSPLFHPLSAYAPQSLGGIPKEPGMFPTSTGALSTYPPSSFGSMHPLLARPPFAANQPSLLDYQRSLAAASAYPWPTAYPYLISPDLAGSSSVAAAAAAAAVGMKRPSTEMEAALEFNAKRMRMESAAARPGEFSSPWEYFAAAAAAASQNRVSAAPTFPTMPCGMESADKTAEYLRKRYMELGPQQAAYLSALPEYARPMFHCACPEHRDEDIRMWGVEDVCKFLNSLEGCGIYSDHFREQRVDGRILAVLSTDHLVKTMGMKLGPAVLLSEAIAKKLQDISKMANCEACRSVAMSQQMMPMALPL